MVTYSLCHFPDSLGGIGFSADDLKQCRAFGNVRFCGSGGNYPGAGGYPAPGPIGIKEKEKI